MAAKGKWLKALLWTVSGLLALFVLLMVAVQVVLSPKMCTSLVLKHYPQFIDGKLSLKEASVSVFSHFPAITLNIDDFIVTYPSHFTGDKKADRAKVENFLELAGACRQVSDSLEARMDTLFSFRKLSVSVNVLALLNGNVRIKNLEFQRPRAYIHVYPDSTSNLDIIKFPEISEDNSDTSSFVIHSLNVKKLFIGSRSNIVYTDRVKNLYSMLYMQRVDFKGNMSAMDPLSDKFKLQMDSISVSGNYDSDTLLFALDHFGMENSNAKTDFDAAATFYAATRALGRVKIPLKASCSLRLEDINTHTFRANLDDISLDCASIHAEGALEAVMADTITLKGWMNLPCIDVQTVMNRLSDKLIPELSFYLTDAKVSARADVDGYWTSGMSGLPGMKLKLDVPLSHVSIVGTDYVPEFELHADAVVKQCADADLNVRKFFVKAPGIECDLHGKVDDVLGKDPRIFVDLAMSASLKEMLEKFGKILGVSGTGDLTANASGSFRLSELNLYNMGGIELDSKINVSGLNLTSPDDSLKLYCNDLSVALGKQLSKRSKKPMFGAKLHADSLLYTYKGVLSAHGRGLDAGAVASPRVIDVSQQMSYCPLTVTLNMDRFYVKDVDSNSIKIRATKNVANIHPSKGKNVLPVIKLISSSEKLRYNMGPHRFSFSGMAFNASARMVDNTGRKRRVQAFKDSLFRKHPDWNDDTLKAKYKEKMAAMKVPEWLEENDFRKSDFQFRMDSVARNIWTTWNLKGDLKLDRARMFTPAFPLKTSIIAFKGGFDNDNIILDTLRVVAGASDIEASGKVTQLRRALVGHGIPKLRVEVRSDTMAFNELLGALAKGQANMEKDLSEIAAMSDEKYDSFVAEKQSKGISEDDPKLVVVPANLDAEIKVRGRGMKYSTLDIYSFNADLIMKRRCLQARNISAKSNAGNVNIEAFYSSMTKKKLSTGFDLTLSDVSASQIITLMPDIDTLMPLLKTFDGMLDCNLAATASLDTNMNIVIPSLNGVIRISGTNLHFNNDKEVEKIMRRLLFRKPKEAKIDSMKVEGVLKDNQLEIFPFILKMDRWTVSIAGIQGLDKKFSYHASLIKSPLIFKLGATIYGDDFDDVHFKLGKPLFKKEQSIPSFSTAIDTTRVNLVHSIRTIFDIGVEAALRENDHSVDMEHHRASQNYRQSASLEKLEELSGKEKALADSLSRSN